MTNPASATADQTIAVIGAGVIGCAIARKLSAQGRRVVLLDRAAPASAGASYGNVGHIATEQVETLPSKALLLGFWRLLFAFDGPLDIPLRRVMSLTPWFARFTVAAFRQESNSRHLAPLVRDSANALARALSEIGRGDLLRRNGHYAVWLGEGANVRAARAATDATRVGVRTDPAPSELLAVSAARDARRRVCGFPTARMFWIRPKSPAPSPTTPCNAAPNSAWRKYGSYNPAVTQLT
jgi:glycine/D-amino acid oxidase-like deaminating enzyme